MKIKPVYIYIAVFIIAILVIIISSNNDSSESKPINSQTSTIPNDDLHKSLAEGVTQEPSSSNVITNVRQKMKDMEEYISSHPNDTSKVKEYAELLAAAHESDKSIELLKSILKIDPNRIDILSQMGRVYFMQKNYKAAQKSINDIIRIDPNNTEALYNLGAIAATEGNSNLARKYWQGIVDKFPNSQTANLAKNSLSKL